MKSPPPWRFTLTTTIRNHVIIKFLNKWAKKHQRKMPFKLRLKKSRQYNVSSKNLFVLSVQLLDKTNVECTLSAQSLGEECLNNVCQRLGLQQSQYFGLKFLSKKGSFWWVDLKRPLKRQLDRYAVESSNLFLGVMFFVSDVNYLHDEITRYHYFLQCKSDILEGKLRCNEDQIILFASYSLQAEFGDHDPERHTTEYLSNFGLLPKQMAQSKENEEAILERVILSHRSLQGMSQSLAEIYYIMEAQRLNGYGLECFAAKDHSGNSIVIGVSLMGIYMWYLNNQPSIYFSWDQIINLIHQKRCFTIEHKNTSKALQIYLDDSQLSKYVWKTCIQQHSFYTKNETVLSHAVSESLVTKNDTKAMNIIHQSVNTKPAPIKQSSSEKCVNMLTESRPSLQESHDSIDGLGVYHTDGQYSENIQCLSNHRIEGTQGQGDLPVYNVIPSNSSSQYLASNSNSSSCISTIASSLQSIYSQSTQSNCGLRGSAPPPLRRASSSDASIHRSLASIQEVIGLDSKPVCSVLPLYRMAPDYDTAIKLKYGIQSCSTGDMSASHLYQSPMSNMNHLPNETQQITVLPSQQQQSYCQYKNYIDLSHLNICDEEKCDTATLFRNNREHPAHTYSSPDLAVPHMQDNDSAPNMIYHFRPPPPYPFKQRSSCSTPDLTGTNVVLSHPLAIPNQDSKPKVPLTHYKPMSVACAKIVTSNPIQQQTVTSSKLVDSQNNLQIHSYENCRPSVLESDQRVQSVNRSRSNCQDLNYLTNQVNQSHNAIGYSMPVEQSSMHSDVREMQRQDEILTDEQRQLMGPMLIAAMNGLSLSRPNFMVQPVEELRIPNDTRIQALESRLAEGQVFLEFERIPKKKPNADFTTALLPENALRNRFKDVFPYEENRVRLTPTTENKTGYINASHLSLSLGSTQRFYIAAQGPLPNTLYSFWQMVWEHHVMVIVMLTEVQEEGRDKCFPYWPQEDGNKLQIGEFQISRNFSMSSSTYVTCSLSLCHVITHQQRSVWHIQYTDWPDHSCPHDLQGFIAFMSEVDAVRRHTTSNQDHSSSSPIIVHCSAGVGRSGAILLCDIMLYCLDHNLAVDVPKVLTHLRFQRMLTVQTLAQYKFVYTVLIQYLKNSRLI